MGSISVDPHTVIIWPQYCAMCGAPAEYVAQASQTSVTGFYLVAYKQKTRALKYPVCRRHRFLCAVLDRPARWGFVGSFLAFVFVSPILWVVPVLVLVFLTGLRGDELDLFMTVMGIASFGLMFFFFLYAAKQKPVKLLGVSDDNLSIDIKDERYAQKFRVLNAKAIRQ